MYCYIVANKKTGEIGPCYFSNDRRENVLAILKGSKPVEQYDVDPEDRSRQYNILETGEWIEAEITEKQLCLALADPDVERFANNPEVFQTVIYYFDPEIDDIKNSIDAVFIRENLKAFPDEKKFGKCRIEVLPERISIQ